MAVLLIFYSLIKILTYGWKDASRNQQHQFVLCTYTQLRLHLAMEQWGLQETSSSSPSVWVSHTSEIRGTSCGSWSRGDFLTAARRLGVTDSVTMSEQHSALPSHRLAQGRDTNFGQALTQSCLLSHTSERVVRLLPLWFTPGCAPNEITPWLFGERGSLAFLRYFRPLWCFMDQRLSNYVSRLLCIWESSQLLNCRNFNFKTWFFSKMIQNTWK